MTDEQEPGVLPYELVMPFVVCQPEGPYESTAFVAGCAFGDHLARLGIEKPEEWEAYVAPAMIPQYDLLAMHYGYKMESEPWDEHPDEWTLVRFVKSDGGDRDVTE